MMKHILLALSPFPEKRPKSVADRAFWTRVIDNYFGNLFVGRDLCFSIISDSFHDSYLKKNYPNLYSKIAINICLDPRKYSNIICTYKMRHALYFESEKSNLTRELAAEVTNQYGNLPPPNLILQFNHHAPYLHVAFKNSPLFNFHEGGLSRPPFPPSWHFGSDKYLAGTDLSTSLSIGLDNNDRGTPNEVVEFIRCNSYAALERVNPFKGKLQLWRKKYRSLYLLPLQVSGEVSFDVLCKYENQYHFLIDVLEKTPADVGLIVTEHPWVPVITREMNDELSYRFPNYIYEADFSLTMNVSTYFVPYVDAVISMSSSLFWHAALMGKTCCGLGDGEFSKVADTNSLDVLNKLLRNESLPPYRYDNLIYTRLTRNWVPGSLMKEPEFLTNWLKHLCLSEHPKPNISDDIIKQNFAKASNDLQLLTRNPLTELKRFDLPLSYKSAYQELDSTMLKVVLVVSPCVKVIRLCIKKVHRILRFGYKFLERKSKALLIKR